MAGGQFGGGIGTAVSPYLIEDAADLNQVRNIPDKYFKLASNINLGVPPYNSNKGWTPIENFTGVIDGNGKKIFNLYINRPTQDNVGLFGKILIPDLATFNRMKITDISFEGVDIVGQNYAGALAGYIEAYLPGPYGSETNCLFQRVSVSGKIKAKTYVGAFVGRWHETYPGQNHQTVPVASNCIAEAVFTVLPGNTYINQFLGGASDLWGDGYYRLFTFFNCVGACSIDKSLAEPVAAYVFCPQSRLVQGTNCYYDKDKWPHGSWSGAGAGVGLTTAELKTPSKVSVLAANAINGIPIWSLFAGRNPELWHQSPDYLFVAGDSGYYTWDPVNAQWVLQSATVPTRQQAIDKGMRHLEYIPQTAWDFFKNHVDPNVINIMDKADTVSIYLTLFNLAKDAANSNNDKVIFRKEVTFNSFGGTLSTINI